MPQLPEGWPSDPGRMSAVTRAAVEAGHFPSIRHEAKRFRIVCPCGWKSHLAWNRKRTFAEAADHMVQAGRGVIPPVESASESPTSESDGVSEESVGAVL